MKVENNPEQVEQVEDSFVNEDFAEITPAQQMQIEAYSDNATIVVFGEKSQNAILQSLQSGNGPIDSVARTANLIHKRLQSSLEKEGEKMTEITMCLGAAHLVSELIVLGEAAGLFEMSDQDRMEAFRQSLQMYFAQGLKDGSIDPVELQKTIEPLMNEEQRAFGEEQAQKNGLMKTPPENGKMYRKQQPVSGGMLGGM